MSDRMPRRQLMATILLTGNPTAVKATHEGHELRIEFDTIADLQAWLGAAGFDTNNLSTHTFINHLTGALVLLAWPTWHGWKITATAEDPAVPEEMAAALIALAEGGAS